VTLHPHCAGLEGSSNLDLTTPMSACFDDHRNEAE